ncbi:MAG: helix-hairpin-helix domain-containing protein [Cellvibrionaceae bacterium]|nr:helix-hairpin-helix domain-containing protein [Cellvibrionaceae bacterium]
MKNQIITFIQTYKPALLVALIASSVLGFSHIVSAAETAPSVSQVIKQVQAVVNINSASADALVERLKGVGPSKARAIIEWREQHGNFTHIEQLLEIKGIGEKTLDINRNRIKL